MINLREKLHAGEAVHGCWVNGGSILDTEILGRVGFDWVTIDLEHGVGTEYNLIGQLQALAGSPTVPLVRVEALVRQRVGRALDHGAAGIIFPMIKTLDEAKQAASYMKYPPDGVRGMAMMTRATGFGYQFDKYYAETKDQLTGILQIESADCLNHLDDIANIEGIDVLFVGPADLTLSLGVFGQYEHPLFLDALKAVQAAAEKGGKATGVLMSGTNEYAKYYDIGFRMLGCGSDSAFVQSGAQNMIDALNHQQRSSNS